MILPSMQILFLIKYLPGYVNMSHEKLVFSYFSTALFSGRLSGPAPFQQHMRKTMEKLSQDSQSSGQDLNLGPPEYKTEMLTTWL
jgi:hypothetical protein